MKVHKYALGLIVVSLLLTFILYTRSFPLITKQKYNKFEQYRFFIRSPADCIRSSSANNTPLIHTQPKLTIDNEQPSPSSLLYINDTYDFFKQLNTQSINDRRSVLNSITSLHTSAYRWNDQDLSYSYRAQFFSWNTTPAFMALHHSYDHFPDPSYYWVYSPEEQPPEPHVLLGTYYIQHQIWVHQHPTTCEDKQFLIVPTYNSGLGSVIHTYGQILQLAMDSNRILFMAEKIDSDWIDEPFCSIHSLACYFDQITNCSLSSVLQQKSYTVIQPTTNLTAYQSVPFLYMQLTISFLRSTRTNLPLLLQSFLKDQPLTDEQKLLYWRIQSSTFLTRLNARTNQWIQHYEAENCPHCSSSYDLSIHVRHGDKASEMKLVYADSYNLLIKYMCLLTNTTQPTIYINSDDDRTLQSILSHPYPFVYMKDAYRINGSAQRIKLLPNITLISFANLKHQLRAHHIIGTFGSNWNRLIFELHSTVGMKEDGYFLEAGHQPCVNPLHCHLVNKPFDIYW